jgi:inosine-uridine nucleoside N-ribohydrolase
MVAGGLAAGSGEFNVTAIVTLGAPIAQLDLQTETAVIAIEHSNDVIPALSGAINPVTENWVTVGREIDLHPGQSALTAHELDRYVETSKLVDEDDSVGVTRIRETVLNKFEGLRLVETQTFELKPIDG